MVNYFNKNNQKISIDDQDVNIYVCGPTVYNDVHIGNLRPILFFSVLRNIFRFQGKNIRLVQNITDVDDKILNYAAENKLDWKDVASEYTDAYLNVLKSYNVNNIEFYKATEFMDTYEMAVSKLMEKDLAYVNSNGAYLRISKIKDYGNVSNQDLDQLEQSVRVENDNDKEDIKDFAILKKDEVNGWNTKFGKMRPGWHLECFGIINKVLGQNLTIHGGGIDLLFPHHENENALNLALYGKDLAKHWIHVGLLTINGEKMSKSIGNLILAKDFVSENGPNILKYLYLQNAYTKPINITDDLIVSAKKFNQNLQNLIYFLDIYKIESDYSKTKYLEEFEKLVENISLPNIYTLLQKIIKDFNKNEIADSDYSNVLLELKIILDVLDLNYDFEVSLNDKDIIKKLNDTNDFETAKEILGNRTDFVKTRKGWSKK